MYHILLLLVSSILLVQGGGKLQYNDNNFCKYPHLQYYGSPTNLPVFNIEEYNNDCIVQRDYTAMIENDMLYISGCNHLPKFKLQGQTHFQEYKEPAKTHAATYAHVTCGYDSPLLVISPADIQSKVASTSHTQDKKNVFVVMLDALSYEAIQRYMPNTVEFLNKQEGFKTFEFTKYSTVGLNSNPNKFQLFGRHDYEKVILEGRSNLTWLWDYAKEQGYLTFVGEDSCPHDSFVWDLMGITRDSSSVDFTLLKQFCGETPSIKNSHCLSGKWAFDYQTRYFSRAIYDLDRSGTKQPVFMFSNFIECHEPVQWGANLLDNSIMKYLQSIIQSSLMDNGVIVFLSDHGLHFGDYGYSSVLGMTENKHPFLYMITKKGTVKDESVPVTNYNRLVTPSDIYTTMASLLGPNNKAPIDAHDYDILNEVVNTDRNCDMAGIPAQFCLCSYGPECERAGIPDSIWSKCSSQFIHPFFFDWKYYAEKILQPTFKETFDECGAIRHWCAFGVAMGWNGTETFTIRDYVAQNPETFQNEKFCWEWPNDCNWVNVVEYFFSEGHVYIKNNK